MKKEHKKISLATYVVTLIVMLVIAIILICIIVKQNKEREDTEQVSSNISESKPIEENEEIKTLDINSEEVNNLYNMVLKYNEIGAGYEDTGGYFDTSYYKDSKVTYSNLSNEEKIVAVLLNVKESQKEKSKFSELTDVLLYAQDWLDHDGDDKEVIIYKSEVLDNTAKRIFGEEFKNDIDYKSLDCCGYGYYYIDGDYYAHSYDGGGLGYVTSAQSSIQKAEQKGEYIYIYDKFICCDYINKYENDGDANYYTSSNKTTELDIKVNYVEGRTEKEEEKEILQNNMDKLTTYKHTFKKGTDGNYYWLSTEISEDK